MPGSVCTSFPPKQIDPIQCIAGNQPLDLVQHSKRIEGAELWLKVVGRQPDSMAVGLACLHAAGLAEVGQ